MTVSYFQIFQSVKPRDGNSRSKASASSQASPFANELKAVPSKHPACYCWWKKSQTTSWYVVNIPIVLKGFIHPRWLFGISSINSISGNGSWKCVDFDWRQEDSVGQIVLVGDWWFVVILLLEICYVLQLIINWRFGLVIWDGIRDAGQKGWHLLWNHLKKTHS